MFNKIRSFRRWSFTALAIALGALVVFAPLSATADELPTTETATTQVAQETPVVTEPAPVVEETPVVTEPAPVVELVELTELPGNPIARCEATTTKTENFIDVFFTHEVLGLVDGVNFALPVDYYIVVNDGPRTTYTMQPNDAPITTRIDFSNSTGVDKVVTWNFRGEQTMECVTAGTFVPVESPIVITNQPPFPTADDQPGTVSDKVVFIDTAEYTNHCSEIVNLVSSCNLVANEGYIWDEGIVTSRDVVFTDIAVVPTPEPTPEPTTDPTPTPAAVVEVISIPLTTDTSSKIASINVPKKVTTEELAETGVDSGSLLPAAIVFLLFGGALVAIRHNRKQVITSSK